MMESLAHLVPGRGWWAIYHEDVPGNLYEGNEKLCVILDEGLFEPLDTTLARWADQIEKDLEGRYL